MFKRISAFLTVLFMGLVLTVRLPVKADTFSIPFSAIPDLLNAFYTVAAGGKIEFSALIGDITGIEDFFENLSDYYDKNYTQPILQRTQNLIDIGLSGLALDGIDSIDSVNNLSIPITPQDIANFMGYDVNWADRYAIPDSITVNPDPNYLTYINTINGTGFYFKDYPIDNFANYGTVNFGPNSAYSFCGTNINNTDHFSGNFPQMYVSNKLNISIVSTPTGNYTFTLPVEFIQPLGVRSNANMFFYAPYKTVVDNKYYVLFNGSHVNNLTYSYSGTLEGVMQYIAYNFRNVSIYVDGELWAYAGDAAVPGITLDNSIPVGNTDNITYGVYPLTSSGDIGLDLAKWGEYIYNQCISGIDSLSMDTVIDDGWDLVDTEDGERAITEEDEEDVAKVIHGFVDTTATTPTPTPDIGDPPVLKIIPPILELPDEIWPDGGRDTTVLAQMVHATDVAIPNDIMTVIWSTIGLLVVGGLISILHK